MFTGLVEHLGAVEVSDLVADPNGTQLSVEASGILGDCVTGDSISVNGTCLTVTAFTPTHATFGVAPETLRRTSLGALKQGDRVCLERACKSDTRMGGHLVQGHVDCVADIVEKKPDGEAFAITFRPRSRDVLKYVVEKGYICLDGASLTVTRVDDSTFSVMIIAYTQQKITLGLKDVGEVVNVEVDQVGKYIERMIAPHIKNLEDKLAALERAST
ncbi:Riboflavin synthase [Taphrina deformans PYCC 5710]|uniref:Riboflavin synthase n=1 Tax=Taphrina deformans (strain PYCC 5710 / ATCC 11124 / CBS 356.35 / IMI 108563 / JCM 9778 / NBRC 8474) TaxID=1097556 RepID=R4XGP9_TAPDE|nr:Riboflavin synthase [Taphrina deformans PYCC 5710]|eukprot:CCG83652.1 Riboflavin synthase [Taphrina deformans PYCC 5710]